MTETASVGGAAHQVRIHALVVPREHGAWGLMLVPLFTGVAAGLASAQHVWPLLLFVAAALFLFWLRTPVESLLGSGPMTKTLHQNHGPIMVHESVPTATFYAFGSHPCRVFSMQLPVNPVLSLQCSRGVATMFVIMITKNPLPIRQTQSGAALIFVPAGNNTKYDLGSEDREGGQNPTVSVFTRDAKGTLRHFYTAHPS